MRLQGEGEEGGVLLCKWKSVLLADGHSWISPKMLLGWAIWMCFTKLPFKDNDHFAQAF